MRTDRRRFLTGAAAVAGGAALGPLTACDDDDRAPRPTSESGSSPPSTATDSTTAAVDPLDPGTWRAQFSLTGDHAHFAAFTLAAHPAAVAAAIARHRAGLDEDTAGYQIEHQARSEQAARRAAADYLDVEQSQIVLTDSTTMGLGVAYGGLRLAEGDEVVTTAHDFYSTYEALRLRAAQTGAKVTTVRLYDDPAKATVDAAVGRLVERITPRTRAIAVTWVHSGTGVKLPIAELGRALAGVNERRDETERVLLCVDAVHGFGVETPTPGELGCDVLVSGTHKWLFGPRGTGLVWLSTAALGRIDPVIPPFEGDSFGAWQMRTPPPRPSDAARLAPGGYHSFEHRWALAEAFQLHRAIGKERVREHTHSQATKLKDGLAELDGIHLVTPREEALSAGIVCVDTGQREPVEVLVELREAGYDTSVTPYRETFLRIGPSIVTSSDEIDGLLAAVEEGL